MNGGLKTYDVSNVSAAADKRNNIAVRMIFNSILMFSFDEFLSFYVKRSVLITQRYFVE